MQVNNILQKVTMKSVQSIDIIYLDWSGFHFFNFYNSVILCSEFLLWTTEKLHLEHLCASLQFSWYTTVRLIHTQFSINLTKFGKNYLVNRMTWIKGLVKLDWLNLSFNTFKVKCKNLILTQAEKKALTKHVKTEITNHQSILFL